MQIQPRRATFDVVIVGSGASGGWAAKRLTEAGLRVAVLEAGRQLTDADYKEHVPAYDLRYRGRSKQPLARERPVQSGSYAVREWNADWFVNDIDEPYVDRSDPAFLWVRPRLVGGRTNIWGRACLRLSDIDFKAASHDGAGVDWPIGYADIAPYYDLVEDYVGINGMTEGLAELPDGRFQPAMPFTCAETALRTRFKEKFGRTLTQGRSANLTRPIHGRQAVPLLRPVRARLRDALVLQRLVHDDGRRGGDGPLHACHGRDGLQGPGRSVDPPRARRPLHRSQDATDRRRSSGASSRSARRPRNRCGSCSTRPPRRMPMAWPTPAACSARA